MSNKNEAVEAALRTIENRTPRVGEFDTIKLLLDRNRLLDTSQILAAEVRRLRGIMSEITNNKEALNAFLLRNGHCGVLVIAEKHFRRLESENERLRELTRWQDMKTAPKFAVADPVTGFAESPYILLINGEGDMAVGCWHNFKDREDEYEDWSDSLGRRLPILEPIKWRPLPPAPAAPGKGDVQND
jgi:hypothetical protein